MEEYGFVQGSKVGSLKKKGEVEERGALFVK